MGNGYNFWLNIGITHFIGIWINGDLRAGLISGPLFVILIIKVLDKTKLALSLNEYLIESNTLLII